MKLKIKKDILSNKLDDVIKGLSTKNLIPILNCLKLELKKEGLYLTSTNNDISIKTFIQKEQIEEIEEEGTIVVYGKLFYEYIKKLPNETINLEELIENKLRIYTSSSLSDLNCNEKDDFPRLDFSVKKKPIKLNNDLFKNLVNKTIYAAANSEERPLLTGLNLQIKEDQLTIVATDSHRCATKTIKLNEKSETDVNIIIPAKNLTEFIKILENNVNEIEIHIFNNRVLFKIDELYFVSRLINGNFPDVSNLINKEKPILLEINMLDFFHALERTAILSREENKQTVHLAIDKNSFQLKSIIPEIGKVEETIEVKNNSDQQLEIAFSAKYMLDALRTLNSESILICLESATDSIIIKSKEEPEFIQLFQPIRTY